MTHPPREKKILVIEDEGPLRQILKEELSEQLHITVIDAKNGLVGLELALKEHPDVILLDLVMPTMDGMSMLEKLRTDEWGRGAHVMILTNLEQDVEKTTKALGHNVYEYIIKSRWSLADVVRRVKEKLEIV